MKILFLTSKGDDYLAACLWDGFRLLDSIDVYDATNVFFHPTETATGRISNLGQYMRGHYVYHEDYIGHRNFDLFVINAAYIYHGGDWALPKRLWERLKVSGKVVLVDGHDSATNEITSPALNIDASFRREISRDYFYRIIPYPLSFAAPERWFTGSENADRKTDVFFANGWMDDERWHIAQAILQTKRRHSSIVATKPASFDHYFDMLRDAKLCICPPGAARSVCLRVFEAAACGSIPVFVGYPDYVRDPWFDDTMSFRCNHPSDLPGLLDHALGCDLDTMRRNLLAYSMVNHTTRARAETVLRKVGLL